MNSREKGKRVERKFRDLLREHGFTAYRGQQYCGLKGNADVMCNETPDIHNEVKGGERLNPHEAMAQAKRDAAGESDVTSKIPAVHWKKIGEEWITFVQTERWIEVLRRSELVRGINGNTDQGKNSNERELETFDGNLRVQGTQLLPANQNAPVPGQPTGDAAASSAKRTSATRSKRKPDGNDV